MSEEPQRRVPRVAVIASGVAIIALVAAGGGYWAGTQRADSPGAQAQSGRRVLYWYDPMVPQQHFDHAGKSPFMDMQLVPRYADEAPVATGVRIDPGVAQNLGVRFATVQRASISRAVTASGVIQFNGRNVANVQARAGGFVERAHARAIGDVIAAGAPIVDIRVPEWAAAQGEYLAVRGAGGDIASAARHRLIMLGMPETLIARIERDGAPYPVFTITSPIAGAITALDVRQGMTVMPGASLATISGISPVWLIASVPQGDAGVARPGGRATATLPAYPGETFSGRIESVLPAADLATRTIEVRVGLDNPQGRLRPGMSGEVRIEQANAEPSLIVPMEAVIRTGTRTMVIVAGESGYVPTEVTLGHQTDNSIEIRSGLREGQRVVASGQFLIDSEASLSGALDRLQASSSGPDAAAMLHTGSGRITAISATSVTLAHGPVASLNWPAMTMQFGLTRPQLAQGLRVGDSIAFRFRQNGGAYVVEEMSKTGAAP
ncbi:MAG TPA: efflux RND transporter periplasmic adaptor subunit [Caulobacterales bacterium]|nr:efflux RND transporter periplasmic adaptor subunit [Caulobacterales bacterium]